MAATLSPWRLTFLLLLLISQLILLTVATSLQILPLDSSLLCPSAINHPNASGTVVFFDQMAGIPNVTSGSDQTILLSNDSKSPTTFTNLAWTMTLHQNFSLPDVRNDRSSLETTFFIGQAPAPHINLYTGSNYMSGCAFVLENLPGTVLYAGQNDSGNCSSILTQSCMTALLKRATTSAFWQTAHPLSVGPYTNLTGPNVLEEVCDSIGVSLGPYLTSLNYDAAASTTPPAFPAECKGQLSTATDDVDPYGSDRPHFALLGPITSNSMDVFRNDSCYTQSFPSLQNYMLRTTTTIRNTLTGNATKDAGIYDDLATRVYPILTVFFPQVNDSRIAGPLLTSADMTCVRPNTFAGGSRRTTPRPKPAVPKNYGLSSSVGAIVGICLTCLIGVLLFVVYRVWLHRQRQWKKMSTAEAHLQNDGFVQLDSTASRFEMGPGKWKSKKTSMHEMDALGRELKELDAVDGEVKEKGDNRKSRFSKLFEMP